MDKKKKAARKKSWNSWRSTENSKDEDRKGRLSSLCQLWRWIFFQLLSFDSELYADLTIL
jgi:hypothetical protein